VDNARPVVPTWKMAIFQRLMAEHIDALLVVAELRLPATTIHPISLILN
jgi:hypothetical protein